MLAAEFGPDGIEFVGQPIGGFGSLDVVGQIKTIVIDDGLPADQIEMISAHAGQTPRRRRRSKSSGVILRCERS